ncbi:MULTISPECIES: tetratricopeptide repeat protein [Dethiosulfovibrio]|uniref:Sel1 domain protein repeat-containing protein n=3 Tax=Dethiosulfovibrio TaxID=47054 RepID=D2Z687_9BACT|nr:MULTISPECIES: sel1 repeat family protein [Dethiosulfovibrio]MCF4142519.1 sel1 repeat family protein [Dethiosulfovibrio marinus]MEA3285459.1 sel1 repeat family protein [Synergistota bacterium]EFC90984.1 Sel1 domain protein repeat-containing protein [Dethiosulfovibrio peptidovorans DSM 11002]MCF4113344.1 sel1 repeat family protein [Dethiosulfovibrio russensis]MCF4145807.1 sel1 repeat family protein [Dethiosulfovibrio acidaminovorans]
MNMFKAVFLIFALFSLCVIAPGWVGAVDSQEFQSIHKLAKQGDSEAQRVLGEAYAAGYLVTADRDQALKWLSLSAYQGNATAQMSLASLYAKMGQKDKAEHWLETAKRNGCIGAARSVSEMGLNSL